MLTVEMKINGTIIGQIYAHNQGYISLSTDDCIYDWHCYIMDQHGKAKLCSNTLVHARHDGFTVLAEKLFTAANKEFNAAKV